MAQTATLKAEPRTGSGSRQAIKLRKAGRIPAIVYGHKEANVAVSVAADELDEDLTGGVFVELRLEADPAIGGEVSRKLPLQEAAHHNVDLFIVHGLIHFASFARFTSAGGLPLRMVSIAANT
mgnify:CR=1 FL=1